MHLAMTHRAFAAASVNNAVGEVFNNDDHEVCFFQAYLCAATCLLLLLLLLLLRRMLLLPAALLLMATTALLLHSTRQRLISMWCLDLWLLKVMLPATC